MTTYQIQLLIKKSGQWIDKSEYVQLPISIKETMDDTLDIGEVVLNFTQDSQEYEAWSEVILNIFTGTASKQYYMVVQRDNVEELAVGLTSYWKHSLTLIEATHKLSAVQMNDFSLTQPLVVAEGISGTAPLVPVQYIEQFSTVSSGYGSDYFTDESKWLENGTITTGRATETVLGIPTAKLESKMFDFQIFRSDVEPKVEYGTNQTYIILPPVPTGAFRIGFTRRISYIFGTFYGSPTNNIYFGDAQFEMAFHSKLTNVTDNIDATQFVDDINNRIRISDLTPNKRYRYSVSTGPSENQPFWEKSTNQSKLDSQVVFKFSDGTVNSFEAITPQRTYRDLMEYNTTITYAYGVGAGPVLTTMQPVQNAEALIPFSYYYEFEVLQNSIGEITSGYYIDDALKKTMNNTTTRLLQDVPKFAESITATAYNALAPHNKIEFNSELTTDVAALTQITNNLKNYGVGQGIRVNLFLNGSYLETDYYIIKSLYDDDLDQGLSLDDLDENFESTNYKTTKLPYRIDPEILSYTSSILSPEFVFAGGKNLLEVLFEIGKIFNGIPRLVYRNDEEIITYDILSRIADINPAGYENALINKSSDADNYATGLVTLVENAIDDELSSSGTIFYPNGISWAKPKSTNPDEAIFTLDNMALNIETPNTGIYKIKKVLVRNWNSANTALDITSQVLEKTIYDTREPYNLDKGKFIYYTRGKSTIEGLSYLAPKNSITGANGDRYAIQLAIKEARGNIDIPASDRSEYPISDYEFKIEYYPVINKARLFSEQSKLTGETRKIYNSFSQPERNISLTQFGENAETILKRTGVNSISSRYVITDIESMPFIGEILNVDNKKYYADMVNIQYDNNAILANAEYTRDINKLDKFVGYRKNYREYEIFADQTVLKNKNINKYCYITYGPASSNIIPSRTFSGNTKWRDSIRQLFLGNLVVDKIDTAVYQMFDIEGRRIAYTYDNIDSPTAVFTKVDNIALPVVTNYTNSSLIFMSSMYDNFSAGNTLEKIPYSNTSSLEIGQWLDNLATSTGLQQTAVYRWLDDQVTVIDDNGDGFEDNRKRLKFVRYADSLNRLPVVRYTLGGSSSFSNLELPKFYSDRDMISYTLGLMTDIALLDKDNKELIQMVTQLHFIAKDPKMTILSPFMKYNRLIANAMYDDDTSLINYTGTLQMIGVRDIRKAIDEKRVTFLPSDVLQSSISASVSSFQGDYTIFMSAVFRTPQDDYEGWGFVYPNTGELALVYEQPLTAGVGFLRDTIYFQLSDEQRI